MAGNTPVSPPEASAGNAVFPGLRLVLAGWFWLALLAFLARVLLRGEPWQVLLATGIACLPLVLLLLHQSSVHLVLKRQRFRPDSFLYRWFSGRFFALLGALCYALPGTLLLLVHLHAAPAARWSLLVLAVPLFALLYRLLDLRLGGHFRPWVRQDQVLRLARIAMATLLALLVLALQLVQESAPLGLLERVEVQRATVVDLAGSAALQQFAQWWQSWEGIRQFVLEGGLPAAGGIGTLQRLLIGLAAFLEAWMLFYLIGMGLAALTLDRSECWRSLGTLSDADRVPPPGPARLALLAALGTFLIGFVFVPLAAYTEGWARQHREGLQEADRRFVLQLERIGDAWYRPGTRDQVLALRASLLEELNVDRQALQAEVNRAFDAMGGNIDRFLDWYYSLGAEYLRIAHLLTGDLDTLLTTRLREHLLEGDAFARVEARLAASLEGQAALQARYEAATTQLLTEARVEVGDATVVPLAEFSPGELLAPPVHEELITLQGRLLAGAGGGAAAGVVTSAVTAKLLSKMLAKGSVKMASKALMKFAAGKAGGTGLGAGAGAVAGAAAGSVVPGLGTAVGAIVGGIAGGILAGLAIDKALIEFEEAVSRQDFRAELLEAVEEARREFLSGLQ